MTIAALSKIAANPDLVAKAAGAVAGMVSSKLTSAAGKRIQALLRGNHDLEKAIRSAWMNAADALVKKHSVGLMPSEEDKNRYQVCQQIQEWGDLHLRPNNPGFPSELTEALVLNEVHNYVIFIKVMLDNCLGGCFFVVPEEWKQEFAERMYQEFADVIKSEDHSQALKTVTIHCLWEILGILGADTTSHVNQSPITFQDLEKAIDMSAVAEQLLGELKAPLREHTDEIRAEVQSLGQTLGQALENQAKLLQSITKDYVPRATYEQVVSKQVIETAREREAKENAEMTAQQRQHKIAELEQTILQLQSGSSSDNNDVHQLIQQAWTEIRYLKFVDAAQLAERARLLDPKNPEANFVAAYALSEIQTGDIASNLSDAVTRYELCLRVLNEVEHPRQRAMTLTNLGNTIWRCPVGSRSANGARATKYLEEARAAFELQSDSYGTALCLNNLGNIYLDIPSQDKIQHLDRALEYYNKALTIFDEALFPDEWAMVQDNLGLVYSSYAVSGHAEAAEKAISHFQCALQIRSADETPREWARSQNNMGNAYRSLGGGDSAEHLVKARQCYEAALTVRTRDRYPRDWATTQMNLGSLLIEIKDGDRAGNAAKAIGYFEQALTVKTQQEYAWDWAAIQLNRASALSVAVDKAGNRRIAEAVDSLALSLTVFTREEAPLEWAKIQYNLGRLALDDLGLSEEERIELSNTHFRSALEILSVENTPEMWAECKKFLGMNLVQRITDGGHLVVNLEGALENLVGAIQWFTKNESPQEFADIAYIIAYIHFKLGRSPIAQEWLEESGEAYELAGSYEKAVEARGSLAEWLQDAAE